MAIPAVILAAIFLFIGTEGNSGIESLYGQFLENLRSRNVNYIAPGEYDAGFSNVTLLLELFDILKVNEEEGYIEIITWLHEEFIDPRLKCNAEEFGGVRRVNIPRQLIWIPDWEVFNPLAAVEYFGEYKAIFFSDGRVLRVPVCKIKVRCSPLDTDNRITCSFRLGSWIYNSQVVSPIPASQNISLHSFRPNLHWSVIEATAIREDMQYPCCEETYSSIVHHIALEKKSTCI